MTTNLFVIANVKNNCEPTVVLEFYCLPPPPEHFGVLAS